MLQKPKEQSNVAAVLFGGEGVLTLAASGVYPKTRVWGSKPENVHCSRAIEPLRIELRWGCEKSRKKTAVGSGVTFKYDPFGRRIYKSSSTATSVYAYDKNNLIEETNSAGSAVARYSQDLRIDQPLAMLRSATTSYYQADGQGSITSLSSSAGPLAQTYGYDSFGKQTSSSGSLMNPFQYTAREFDPETNLYFYRARYLDTSSGRFINEDPVQFQGGINFYTYVTNNPVNLTDARGLQPGHDPFFPLSWCHCELAGPREPLMGGFCLYHCECDDQFVHPTVLFPMGGELGLRKMCGAMMSCPWEVFAIRLNISAPFGVYFPYAGRP